MSKKDKRILAVASFGGHWVQLLRLKDFLKDYDVSYASTTETAPEEISSFDYYRIIDSNRWEPTKAVKSIGSIIKTIYRVNPDIVITTGALPGLITLMLSKILRKKTVWIDSIANVNSISASGKIAKYFSDLYLTQWQHLQGENEINYFGKLI